MILRNRITNRIIMGKILILLTHFNRFRLCMDKSQTNKKMLKIRFDSKKKTTKMHIAKMIPNKNVKTLNKMNKLKKKG